jgi:hypothetical protein
LIHTLPITHNSFTTTQRGPSCRQTPCSNRCLSFTKTSHQLTVANSQSQTHSHPCGFSNPVLACSRTPEKPAFRSTALCVSRRARTRFLKRRLNPQTSMDGPWPRASFPSSHLPIPVPRHQPRATVRSNPAMFTEALWSPAIVGLVGLVGPRSTIFASSDSLFFPLVLRPEGPRLALASFLSNTVTHSTVSQFHNRTMQCLGPSSCRATPCSSAFPTP